jgi:hypothetical protein
MGSFFEALGKIPTGQGHTIGRSPMVRGEERRQGQTRAMALVNFEIDPPTQNIQNEGCS